MKQKDERLKSVQKSHSDVVRPISKQHYDEDRIGNRMKHFFDSTPKTIQRLVTLVNQETLDIEGGGRPEWAEGKIKELLKKLKKGGKALEELHKAIVNEDSTTDCCLIPRDDKKEAHAKKFTRKKEHPHALYLKMWRYPFYKNEYKEQLKFTAVDNCNYSFEGNPTSEWVCMNPWHYNYKERFRTDLPGIPVSRLKDPPQFVDLSLPPVDPFEEVPNATLYGNDMCSPDMSSSEFFSPDNSPQGVSGNSPAPEPKRFDFNNLTSSSTNRDSFEEEIDEDMDTEESPTRTIHSPITQNSTPEEVMTELVKFKEPDVWMNITYYEENRRIGQTFDAKTHYLIVDGFTNPKSHERLSLGYFSQVDRTQIVNDTRKQIGYGVRFYYLNGEIYCECLSKHPIFVQSAISNMGHGFQTNTVIKVPPTCNLKLYNAADFANLLASKVKHGYGAVYALSRICTVRISFVKGWGSDYHRQNASSTPCWIELHLRGPLEWIDNVNQAMGVTPATLCSSFS